MTNHGSVAIFHMRTITTSEGSHDNLEGGIPCVKLAGATTAKSNESTYESSNTVDATTFTYLIELTIGGKKNPIVRNPFIT